MDPDLEKPTDFRLAVGNSLKERFGLLFCGGVGSETLEDLGEAALPSHPRAFAEAIRQYLVSVSTIGLHRSNILKLASTLAASQVLVSEPL